MFSLLSLNNNKSRLLEELKNRIADGHKINKLKATSAAKGKKVAVK